VLFVLIIVIRWMEIYKSWMWTRYVLKGSKISMRQTISMHVARVRTDVAK
jgi:hypothetical protein